MRRSTTTGRRTEGDPVPAGGGPAEGRFSASAAEATFKELSALAGPEDWPVELFLRGISQTALLIETLGPALTIASRDVAEKVAAVRAKLREVEVQPQFAPAPVGAREHLDGSGVGAPPPPYPVSVGALCEYERQRSGSGMAASRSIVRLEWFCAFVTALLGCLLADEGVTLTAAAQTAYGEVLAPHHGWLLRQTIGVALNLCPSRATFMGHLLDDPAGKPRTKVAAPGEDAARVAAFYATLRDTSSKLQAYLRANSLADLP
jgi:hypothetical protein